MDSAAVVRRFFEALVRLYFPVIGVDGADHIPPGPVVFVPNHSNALLDPLVLRLALQRPVRFLAKNTLFGNAAGRFVMNAFGAIPVYRRQDGRASRETPPRGEKLDPNERTFALCRAALGRSEPLALFPEGTSHSDPRLKPLKTGAARIVLGAEAEHQGNLGVSVVPVGIGYERKAIFRSAVLVVVGSPICSAEAYALWQEEPQRGINALTEAMRTGLNHVVLQADTRELLEGAVHLAASISPSGAGINEPANCWRLTKLFTRSIQPALIGLFMTQADTCGCFGAYD